MGTTNAHDDIIALGASRLGPHVTQVEKSTLYLFWASKLGPNDTFGQFSRRRFSLTMKITIFMVRIGLNQG